MTVVLDLDEMLLPSFIFLQEIFDYLGLIAQNAWFFGMPTVELYISCDGKRLDDSSPIQLLFDKQTNKLLSILGSDKQDLT